ncbi:Uncharacterised protein [Bacillus freudenreichii]|nr:Uncharacterised protein [Bacillus freudenreichii]
MTITLKTIMFKKEFTYIGSVEEGVKILYGDKQQMAEVTSRQFVALLDSFRCKTVNVGASRTNPGPGSIGEWLKNNVSKVAIASYIAPILIHEGFAEKVDNYRIRFY